MNIGRCSSNSAQPGVIDAARLKEESIDDSGKKEEKPVMEKKSNHLVGNIICGLLTASGIAVSIIKMAGSGENAFLFFDVFSLVLSLLIGYYALWGYRKPHGNLLKYVILAYAVFIICGIPSVSKYGPAWRTAVNGVAIGLYCYIAGRLDRIKQNSILLMLATVLMAVTVIYDICTGNATIGVVSGVVVWLDICVAYFLRYKEHREAGLMDAPKK